MVPEFAGWPQAPGGRAQQPRASEAQGRGSAQRLQGGALAEVRVWLQVVSSSLQKTCVHNSMITTPEGIALFKMLYRAVPLYSTILILFQIQTGSRHSF